MDKSIGDFNAAVEYRKLLNEATGLRGEVRRLQAFYDYFSELHGTGLEVANWHLNGETEPFDEFFESAEQEMNYNK